MQQRNAVSTSRSDAKMELFLRVAVFLVLGAPLARATEPPRAFEQPYRDGAVMVLWKQDYTDEGIAALLARLAAAGSNSVMVPIFGCQTDIHSSDVGACEIGSRDQPMRIVRKAVERGMRVTILPILVTPKWDWRGFFDPKDVDGWFRSYAAWLTALAREVSAAGVRELIAGSEFKALYRYGDRWRTLLRELRPVFPGPLVVTANWDQFDYTFWDESDAIGVSAYFPLSKRDDPSVEVLSKAWAKWKEPLMALSRKWKRPLYLTEVGYQSTTSAAHAPWGAGNSEEPDNELQARCYQALSATWGAERALVRANLWGMSDPDADTWNIDFDFLGKPAETVVREFFRVRAALAGL